MTGETEIEASDTIQHPTTYAAMVAVMRDIGVIAKSRRTEAQGKYNFRGIEELLEALGPVARRHGLITTPRHAGPPIIDHYPTSGGGSMNWVILPMAVEFRATDDEADVIVAEGYGEAADSGDKGVAKAFSVGYREIMFKEFVIPTRGEDYDTEQSTGNINRISDEEVARQQAEAALAKVEAMGWTSIEDWESAWEEFKAACKVQAPSGEWMRSFSNSRSVSKAKLTAAIWHEVSEVLSNAKADGGWKANYEPPAVTS